ncbi:MAG: NADH:flavin oxidoreductase [Pirellulaceae bacterium]|nr:NADH:flavin oxidoreductase [Pirellulaceae bacterium]
MAKLNDPMTFMHGPRMKNRFMLAPMTNCQSREDGCLADEEFHWLTMRAQGGFGLTMTCAAHVQEIGKGFSGQLGIFSDSHIPGLSKLAKGIEDEGSLSVIQLHHAGMRSPEDLIGEKPVCASDNSETGARALTHAEVMLLIEDFIEAAERAEKAGFDGVELHGAHGYIITQFLSPEINKRTDEFGGSLENRTRILFEMIKGIRLRCGKDFILGVRISPERFGLQLDEMIALANRLLGEQNIDFLDVSLWDVFKEPEQTAYQGRTLMSYFTELERGETRLGVAGKIHTPADARRVMDADIDWIMLGKAGILHHDYPNRYLQDENFQPVQTPVSRAYLASQGLSEKFINYMKRWPDFVSEATS